MRVSINTWRNKECLICKNNFLIIKFWNQTENLNSKKAVQSSLIIN